MEYTCMCQDSSGTPHNVPMSEAESKQDGMCSACADNVWGEMDSSEEFEWHHKEKGHG